MGCGGDIKEKENKPQNLNKQNEKVEENRKKEEENRKKEEENRKKEEENRKKEEENRKKEEENRKKEEENRKKEEENKKKENEKAKSVISEKDIDTTDFDEDNYPFFQSNYFEKFIKNIRKILIRKNEDGTIKVNKLFITLDFNRKMTKIIKIEKEDKKKHLTQKILKGECSLDKVKSDLEQDNKEFHIETKDILSKPQTTDIYLAAQKVNGIITRFQFFYNKQNANFNISQFQGTNSSYSTSSSSRTNLGPEEIVDVYNEYISTLVDYKKEVFCLIEQPDYDVKDFTEFQQEGLIMHNKYRADHHAPEMQLNKELCEIAQKYADYLAKNSLFQHSHDRFKGAAMGENLFMCSGYKPNGGEGVTSWYNEIKDYDFKNGRSTGGVIGHFTQVVWKGSKYLGIGIGQNGNSYYVVGNYYPAGNWEGEYTNNVLAK